VNISAFNQLKKEKELREIKEFEFLGRVVEGIRDSQSITLRIDEILVGDII